MTYSSYKSRVSPLYKKLTYLKLMIYTFLK